MTHGFVKVEESRCVWDQEAMFCLWGWCQLLLLEYASSFLKFIVKFYLCCNDVERRVYCAATSLMNERTQSFQGYSICCEDE